MTGVSNERRVGRPTDIRQDGDFYVADYCKRYHRLDESEFITCAGHNFQAKSGKIAMQIDWMTRDEMSQAIPPAYSQYIAEQFRKG